jgi:hypothetical protein
MGRESFGQRWGNRLIGLLHIPKYATRPSTMLGEQALFEAMVINLPCREDRRRRVLAECEKARVTVNICSALDPATARSALPESRRQGGELGLLASTIKVLEFASARSDLDWVLILEDDAQFSRDLSQLRIQLENLPPEVMAVRAGYLSAMPRRYRDIPRVRSWRDIPHALRAFVCLRSRAKYIVDRLRLEYGEKRRRVPAGSIRNLQWGAHLWAIRPEHAIRIRDDLLRLDEAIDVALIQLIREKPSQYRNLRTSFARQYVSASDIQDRRYRIEGARKESDSS